MTRYINFFLILFLPVFLFAQDTPAKKTEPSGAIPVQSQYSDKFEIKNVDFNKKVDLNGKGENLDVTFILDNHMDDPQDLYLFVVASYEVGKPKETLFDNPIPPHKRIRSFVPFPLDLANFEYSETDDKGQLLKDEQGKEIHLYKKFPKNPQAGIDPSTGKPYHLVDRLVVRTNHMSKYRHNFAFFNNVTILVFDKDGKPIFRQQYELKGYRH